MVLCVVLCTEPSNLQRKVIVIMMCLGSLRRTDLARLSNKFTFSQSLGNELMCSMLFGMSNLPSSRLRYRLSRVLGTTYCHALSVLTSQPRCVLVTIRCREESNTLSIGLLPSQRRSLSLLTIRAIVGGLLLLHTQLALVQPTVSHLRVSWKRIDTFSLRAMNARLHATLRGFNPARVARSRVQATCFGSTSIPRQIR